MADNQDEQIIQEIGRRVKSERELKGLSLTDLAALAELDPGTINRIELAKQSPAAVTIVQIARALKIEVSRLLPS